MPVGLRFTEQAKTDLFDLWIYVAADDPTTADRVVDRIESACARLQTYPQLGPARPEIGDGARALIIGRWLALYRVTPDAVQVVRVIDGARDLANVDWRPESP